MIAKENGRTTQNEVILTAIAKIAMSTISIVANDKDDLLHNPTTISELEDNGSTLASIVSLKIKNNLIKN